MNFTLEIQGKKWTAVVDDPTNAKRDLDRVTTPKKGRGGLAPASIRLHVTTQRYSKR